VLIDVVAVANKLKLVDAAAALTFAELQAARNAANRTEYSIAVDTPHIEPDESVPRLAYAKILYNPHHGLHDR
jgi:hypothetical protein